jgi:hypothetical protein
LILDPGRPCQLSGVFLFSAAKTGCRRAQGRSVAAEISRRKMAAAKDRDNDFKPPAVTTAPSVRPPLAAMLTMLFFYFS